MFGGVYKLVAVKKPDGSYTPKMKCSDSASKAIIGQEDAVASVR